MRTTALLAALLFAGPSLADSLPIGVGGEEIGLIVFLGVECPLARLYTPSLNELHDKYADLGLKIMAVDANQRDTAAAIEEFERTQGLKFPFVRDAGAELAERLGATRSPEAFVIMDGQVRYHGRIDDRYRPGDHPKAESQRRDVEEAILDLLAGRPVRVAETVPVGCFIDKGVSPEAARESVVTYAEAADVFHRKCAECHRPGQVAPFSLLTYEDAASWAATIREVIQQDRMPPWGADPRYGRFTNDISLTSSEKQLLFDWIEGGALEGDPDRVPAPPAFHDGWKIGAPDLVLTLSEPYSVPAEGIIEYQEFTLDPHFTEDAWIQAVEIRPGNRAIVHHVNTFLRPKDAPPDRVYISPAGDVDLASFVPGNSVTSFGEGIAKIVPAGWMIVLNIHYVTIGTPQQDQTSIGFKLMDSARVTHEAATRKTSNFDIVIGPHSKLPISASMTLEDDYMLAAIYPHMHLRGREARFEVIYPTGEKKTLLNVKYDFNWQYRYVLAEPEPLPAGTKLVSSGVFDNTAANPNNPDPNATVRYGRDTTDEMFHGMWDVYRPIKREVSINFGRLSIVFAVAGLVLLAARKRG